MRSTAGFFVALTCCLTCYGEPPRADAEAPAVRTLFACQIYSARPGVKVIETAADYAAVREDFTEIVFPEGVRRAESKMLRELGDVDFERNRVVLIWNTSMADEIRLIAAGADEIRVKNVSTGLNAMHGSAHFIALVVPRGEAPPHVTWIGKPPKARVGGPLDILPPRPPESTSPRKS